MSALGASCQGLAFPGGARCHEGFIHAPPGSVTSVTWRECYIHLLLHQISQTSVFAMQRYYLYMLLQVGKPPEANEGQVWSVFMVAFQSGMW